MIPASYLFKDLYRQSWETPDALPVREHRHRFLDGLVSPLAAAVTALLAPRTKKHGHRFGSHAWE